MAADLVQVGADRGGHLCLGLEELVRHFLAVNRRVRARRLVHHLDPGAGKP
ncbi:hypothetical protein [Kitasatospora sp. NPDC085464]|uniref:hypothetical protein n=1 Tax=Kitasatospora sp. NPDC085464 TaxID=3364063 RepID=UPI0037C68FA4